MSLPEDDLELTEEDLKGAGLTAEEIALSPEIGAWAEDDEAPSGAEYVEKLRRGSPQLWTLQEPHRSAIERGMAWAAENPPAETDLDDLLARQGRRTEAKRSRGSSK